MQRGRGLDTPLHAAARVSGAKEAELLLEYGADRTSRNTEGKKPLDLTTDQNIKQLLQAPGTVNTPTHYISAPYARVHCDTDVVSCLVLQVPALCLNCADGVFAVPSAKKD